MDGLVLTIDDGDRSRSLHETMKRNRQHVRPSRRRRRQFSVRSRQAALKFLGKKKEIEGTRQAAACVDRVRPAVHGVLCRRSDKLQYGSTNVDPSGRDLLALLARPDSAPARMAMGAHRTLIGNCAGPQHAQRLPGCTHRRCGQRRRHTTQALRTAVAEDRLKLRCGAAKLDRAPSLNSW